MLKLVGDVCFTDNHFDVGFGVGSVIKAGFIKVIYLDKKTVASYEVKDESSSLTARNWGRHILAIQFKDGRRSLIEVNDKIYRAIMTKVF